MVRCPRVLNKILRSIAIECERLSIECVIVDGILISIATTKRNVTKSCTLQEYVEVKSLPEEVQVQTEYHFRSTASTDNGLILSPSDTSVLVDVGKLDVTRESRTIERAALDFLFCLEQAKCLESIVLTHRMPYFLQIRRNVRILGHLQDLVSRPRQVSTDVVVEI